MIKNVVWHKAGIVRKQAELLHTWEGYNFYGLKEDIKNDKIDDYAIIYAEHNNNLFYIGNYCNVKQLAETNPQKIKDYMQNFEQGIIDEFNQSLQQAKDHTYCWINKGITQYLNREQEAIEVAKEYMQWKKIDDKQKRIEKEQIEQKQKQEEQKKLNAAITQAEQDLKEYKDITSNMFVELCKKYNVELPIKLKGWINKSLRKVSITKNGCCSYSYCGNKSTTIGVYTKMLIDVITESEDDNKITQEEINHLFGIKSYQAV